MTKENRKILVIDDDVLVRQSIVAYLEDSGYDVHDEPDGRDGIAWFKENRPDLVLTDLRMPDVDGLAILKMVKEVDDDIPVIVVSGMGMVNDVAQALRLGAADYLVKPLVDMEVLIHSINRAIGVMDLQRENKRYRSELEAANRELKEHVRVLERDQKAGRQVQNNLLPPTPVKFGNVAVAHKIIPSLYLSGDFVDYGLLNERYLCFYLTDVSGHGASSAFVTVWLKQLVRRLFREKRLFTDSDSFGVNVGQMISIINQELFHSRFGCHLTCFVGIVDIQTLEMRYVLGGHLPLPVVVGNGSAKFLQGNGKPVGIFENAAWDVYSTQLPKDFSLIVFSDGVLEILPPKDLIAKEQRLLDLLSNSQGNIESVCTALDLDNLEAAPDDIAILSLSSIG